MEEEKGPLSGLGTTTEYPGPVEQNICINTFSCLNPKPFPTPREGSAFFGESVSSDKLNSNRK
jgi:hypothetical protein